MTTAIATDRPVYLCENCAAPNQGYYLGAIAQHNICAICRGLAIGLYEARVLDPWTPDRRRPTPTTCVTVEPYRSFVWDVNGYYRELGVSTEATRLEIRRAYQAHYGYLNPRLTYIVKQLLDPDVRASYDACRPGEVFFDRYIEESFERRVAQETSRNRALGDDLTEWEKIDLDHLRNKSVPVVDSAGMRRQTDGPGWRNYLWRTSFARYRLRVGLLSEWQTLLVSAAASRQEVFRFAVGFAGGDLASPWRVEALGDLQVVFLNDESFPEPEMAEAVIDAIIGTH